MGQPVSVASHIRKIGSQINHRRKIVQQIKRNESILLQWEARMSAPFGSVKQLSHRANLRWSEVLIVTSEDSNTQHRVTDERAEVIEQVDRH